MVGFGAGVIGGAGIAIVIQGIDKFSTTFTKANTGLTKLTAASKMLTTAFGFLAIAGTAVIASVLVKGIKQAIAWEDAFIGVRKTVNATEEEFANLENRFKEMTRTTPITFTELSKIGELAGQLGVEGVDNISKFTKSIADISVTTNLTSEQAATDFARIANIMQEPLENIDKMASTVVDLGNNFATTESEITTFAQRISGAGKIAGLTVDQVFAISAAFSSVGVQAEAGGTAVQKVLTQMTQSVAQGGKKLDSFADAAGLTGDEFKVLFKEDPGEAFEQFVLGLGTAGNEAFGILEELGLQDQRLIRSFLSLSNAGDLITETMNTANNAFDENTALTEEADKKYAGTASQLQMLRNEFDLLVNDSLAGVNLGFDQFAAIVRDDLFPALKETLDAFVKLADNKDLLTAIGAVAIGILKLLTFLFMGIDTVAKFSGIFIDRWLAMLNIVKFVAKAIELTFFDMSNKILTVIESTVNGVISGMELLINAGRSLLGKDDITLGRLDLSAFKADTLAMEEQLKGLAEGANVGLVELGLSKGTTVEGGIVGSGSFGSVLGNNGSNVSFHIENINGMDPDAVAEALEGKLGTMIKSN